MSYTVGVDYFASLCGTLSERREGTRLSIESTDASTLRSEFAVKTARTKARSFEESTWTNLMRIHTRIKETQTEYNTQPRPLPPDHGLTLPDAVLGTIPPVLLFLLSHPRACL